EMRTLGTQASPIAPPGTHGFSRSAPARTWKEAWTGGQYSAIRIIAAGSIAVALTFSTFSGDEIDYIAALFAAIALAVAAGMDVAGRAIAAILASGVAFYDVGLLGPAACQFASLWLSAHVLLPRRPYGSLGAT